MSDVEPVVRPRPDNPGCPKCGGPHYVEKCGQEPDDCVVCDRPIDSGDEPGWAYGPAGFSPVCSVACTEEFYAEGGGFDE